MDAKQVSGLARAFLLELISMGEEIELSTVLRPDNVMITAEKIRLKDPMPSAAYVPVDGFAAPEQYVAGNCEKAPIYFMGALMYTLLHGAPPPPVRSRLNQGEKPVNGGGELDRVILRCLALHPDDRYANLSFVLDALRQVDGVDGSEELVQSLEQSPVGEEIKPEKKTKKKLLILLLVLALLAGGVLAYTLVQGGRAEKALDEGEYGVVVSILDSVPWLKTSRSESYRYATGMQLWKDGSYDQALAIFEELDGYADSAELVKQVQYGKALSLLQARQLEQAEKLFGMLGDYADSAAQKQTIAAYRQAQALEDPLGRYQAFAEFGEYLDSPSLAREAGEEAYGLAMAAYKAGDIATAESQFAALGNYGDAPVYQQLCAVWTGASESAEENRAALASAMAYSGVADLESVLMSDRFFMVFMEGAWNSSDGGGEMSFAEDSFRAPLLGTAGARWAFQNRSITNGANTVAVFGYLSPNEVTMTVSATGETFTYQRAV